MGFRGNLIEGWISNKFFSKENPVYEIGVNVTIIGLYEEIVSHAIKERNGYQQLISSIVFYLMGEIYYKEKNRFLGQSDAVEKINEARAIMKRNIDNPMPAGIDRSEFECELFLVSEVPLNLILVYLPLNINCIYVIFGQRAIKYFSIKYFRDSICA